MGGRRREEKGEGLEKGRKTIVNDTPHTRAK